MEKMYQELITSFDNGNKGWVYNQWMNLPLPERQIFLEKIRDLERTDIMYHFLIKLL